jgi:hypothetical protein
VNKLLHISYGIYLVNNISDYNKFNEMCNATFNIPEFYCRIHNIIASILSFDAHFLLHVKRIFKISLALLNMYLIKLMSKFNKTNVIKLKKSL